MHGEMDKSENPVEGEDPNENPHPHGQDWEGLSCPLVELFDLPLKLGLHPDLNSLGA